MYKMFIWGGTAKPVLSGHSKRRPKIGFQVRLSLNAGQKYCRMPQESILQYFPPSLSYHLSLRSLFCLFLSGHFTQVLLYIIRYMVGNNILQLRSHVTVSVYYCGTFKVIEIAKFDTCLIFLISLSVLGRQTYSCSKVCTHYLTLTL